MNHDLYATSKHAMHASFMFSYNIGINAARAYRFPAYLAGYL
jgi:hypothetical protein